MNDSRKRWLPLAMILVVGVLAIVSAERHHVSAPASPQAMLDAAADAQRELTRVPAHFDPMSDTDEIALGDRLAANYDTELNPHTSTPNQRNQRAEIDAYLDRVGMRTAAHARRKLPWHFHYIPDEHFVNAFALPGGHVFIGAGLIKLMHSEDALAGVLGHEVEHIDLRHCADRYQAEAHVRNLDPTGLVSLPVGIFIAGYSKQQELEADRDGTTLAVEANYSPLGIRDLFLEFGKLEHGEGSEARRDNPLDEAAHLSLATLSGYFRSHPPAEDRVQQLDALIATNHWATPKLTPLRLSLGDH